MDIMDGIRAGFKELIVPELERIKEDNREVKAILELTNKRLDDVNTHMADQSRRIDSLRDEVHAGIKSVREELTAQMKSVREELTTEIKSVREELRSEIKEVHRRIDETNKRMDRLYEVIVRRDEHYQLVQRLHTLEGEVEDIKRKIAA